MALSRFARQQINEKILQISQKISAPIDVGQIRLGFGSASFEDIRIGSEALVVIDRATAKLSLNPFASNFGELDTLTVQRMKLKAGSSQVHAHFDKLASNASAQDSIATSLLNKVDKLFKFIPTDKLWLKSGSLTLLDQSGESKLTVRGLELYVEKPENKILFRIGSIAAANQVSEEHIQGRFQQFTSKNQYRFFIRKKPSRNSRRNDWSISGQTDRDFKELNLSLNIRRLPSTVAELLVPILGDQAVMDVKAQVTFNRSDTGQWLFDTKVKSQDLRLKIPVLSANPIGPVRFDFIASGSYKPTSRQLALDEAIISLPPKSGQADPVNVRIHGNGKLTDKFALRDIATKHLPLVGLSWQGEARLLDTSCQSLITSSPAGFTPTLDEFKLDGLTSGAVQFRFDGDQQRSLAFEFKDLQWTCRVLEAPFTYSTQHLSGPFTIQRPVGKNSQQAKRDEQDNNDTLEVSVNPALPGFTPLTSIAKNVNQAFIASEDAAFYTHNGIDKYALEFAAHKNFLEQRVAVGGSTITMQTVKNLFLSHQRTVSRKIQELFLAWHVENILDKDRILEIYLNIVEFGPGIYGITKASEHFFGKHPYDLNLTEAAYLASLLPSPKTRYRSYCLGRLTPGMRDLTQSLLRRMLSLGRINWERYQQALTQNIQFNPSTRQETLGCGTNDDDAS